MISVINNSGPNISPWSGELLSQNFIMSAPDLQYALAESVESPGAKDFIQVHHVAGDELKISFHRIVRVFDGKAILGFHSIWKNSVCTRQKIIRKHFQKPWLLRVGFLFQCIVNCTAQSQFNIMAELIQREKLNGFASSLTLPLPSKFSWEV